MTDRIRLLVVDDHPVFRQGIAAQIALADQIELVGEAATAAQAIAMAASLSPDVILMDLHLPDGNGIDATRTIVAAQPNVGVLVLTMYDDDGSVFAAMRAGARGYLLKGSDGMEIMRAITAVANGEAIFGPAIARRIAAFLTVPARPNEAFPQLTDREREVLDLVAAGWSNQQMAKHFVLSPKTVRNHVSNIFTKLQVADRQEAISKARDAGLGRLSS